MGRTPQVPESKAEKDNVRHALDRYNERIQDGYVGLEKAALADLGRDKKGALQGIATAELAKQEAQGYALAAQWHRPQDFSALSGASAQSNTLLGLDTAAHAQGLDDQQRFNAIQRGLNKVNTSASLAMSAAQRSYEESTSKLQAQLIRQEAQQNMFGGVANSAMSLYGYKKAADQAEVVNQGTQAAKASSSALDRVNLYEQRPVSNKTYRRV